MASAVVLICNEHFVPVAQVEVECYDLATGSVLATGTTGSNGQVSIAVPEGSGFFFRPRLTRGADKAGGSKRLYRIS